MDPVYVGRSGRLNSQQFIEPADLVKDFRQAFNSSNQAALVNKCHDGFIGLINRVKQEKNTTTIELAICEKAQILRMVSPRRPVEEQSFKEQWNTFESVAKERIKAIELEDNFGKLDNGIDALKKLNQSTSSSNFGQNSIRAMQEVRESIQGIDLKSPDYQEKLAQIKMEFEKLAAHEFGNLMQPAELKSIEEIYNYLQPLLDLPKGEFKMDVSNDETLARELQRQFEMDISSDEMLARELENNAY